MNQYDSGTDDWEKIDAAAKRREWQENAGFYSYPKYHGQGLSKGIYNWNSSQEYFDNVNKRGDEMVGILEIDRGAADDRMTRIDGLESGDNSEPFIMFEFIKIDHNKGDDSTLSSTFLNMANQLENYVSKKVSGEDSVVGQIVDDATTAAKTAIGAEDKFMQNLAKKAGEAFKNIYKNWRPKKYLGDTIVLYMTPGISIADTVSYHEDTRKLASMVEGIVEKGVGTYLNEQSASDVATLGVSAAAWIGGIVADKAGGGNVAGTIFGASVADAIKGEAEILRGKTLNPNEYLRFKSTPLRNFNFEFKFLPDTPDESDECRDIIKSFRSNMHAHKESDITIQVPSTCIVSFHGIKDMIQLPPLVVTTCTTSYSPTVQARFKGTKQPVEMNVSLGLQEIRPIYDTDVLAGY